MKNSHLLLYDMLSWDYFILTGSVRLCDRTANEKKITIIIIIKDEW